MCYISWHQKSFNIIWRSLAGWLYHKSFVQKWVLVAIALHSDPRKKDAQEGYRTPLVIGSNTALHQQVYQLNESVGTLILTLVLFTHTTLWVLWWESLFNWSIWWHLKREHWCSRWSQMMTAHTWPWHWTLIFHMIFLLCGEEYTRDSIMVH